MQRLSILAITAIAVLALSGAGFTKPIHSPMASAKARVNFYYWYSTLDGTYNDLETMSYEIMEMEWEFGCVVDQNSANGFLVEQGYIVNQPQIYPPSVFLYAHFR